MGVSTFIPKPHTPFQWDRQITIEDTQHKHRLLRDIFGKDGPKFGRHDALMSFLEGVISRGDRRVGRLLLLAWQKGARFDGWNEHLRWDAWQEALAEWGPNTDDYLGERGLDETLPWDHIDVLVTKKYFRDEYLTSRENRLTSDCRYTKCNDCGVIHDETKLCANMLKTSRQGIKIERNWKRPAHLGGGMSEVGNGTGPAPVTGIAGSKNAAERKPGCGIAPASHLSSPPSHIHKGQGGAPVIPIQAEEAPDDWRRPEAPAPACRLIATFAKHGTLRFLSHLELNSVFQRAMRRANLPVAMSQGFHPQPKLAFATPLPTGLESFGEFADITLTEEIAPEDFRARFNAAAMEGLEVLSVQSAPLEGKSLQAQVVAAEYEAWVPGAVMPPEAVRSQATAFTGSESHVVTRRTKNGPKSVNIRALVEDLDVREDAGGCRLLMRLTDRPGAKGRPEELLAVLTGGGADACRIRKTSTQLVP
jgi:radical SAM-linked protein